MYWQAYITSRGPHHNLKFWASLSKFLLALEILVLIEKTFLYIFKRCG